jgi:hypothetical protein
MTPEIGPPFSAIHFATRRQCDLAGYLPEGGGGRSGFAIGCFIFDEKCCYLEKEGER